MLASIFPPLPPYEGMHPLVVHYPIALLMITPIFVILAAAWKKHTRPLLVAALLISVLGVAAAFLATSTGEAGEKFAKGIPGADKTLHEHEELAEFARNLFIVVTVVLAGFTAGAWKLGDRLSTPLRWGAVLIFLVIHGFSASVLASAAHEGGKLVHLHGVRAPLAPEVYLDTGVAPPVPRQRQGREDHH
jgi:uncharacterized membrane protein